VKLFTNTILKRKEIITDKGQTKENENQANIANRTEYIEQDNMKIVI
jgi:hypothetical protein